MKISKEAEIHITLIISNQETAYEVSANSELVEIIKLGDTEVGNYRIMFSFPQRVEQEQIYTDRIELIGDYIAFRLKSFLNQLSPVTDHVEITEDTHNLLQLQAGYCQYCGKKLLESYGQIVGILKKCPNCRRISFVRYDR